VPSRRGRTVHEADALHALAHPLRVRILELLREPASAAELAPRLKQSRQNVSYHLKELERGGLVLRAGERRAGALTETLYRAQADSLVVSVGGPVALADCDTPSAEGGPLLRAGRWQGNVQSLHLAPAAGAPMESVTSVRAIAGRGLEGDRYHAGAGTFSKKRGTGRDVTLIELEALRALSIDQGVDLAPGDARRNVVTCGVPLNHLVGREFRLGRVVLRGMRLCEPCTYLSGLLGTDVKTGLIHRGGLRADIVRPGRIAAGDTVAPC
jgi:DNA-binding transcriptional ArsR family regulator